MPIAVFPLFIVTPQYGFIAPHIREIVGKKNLTIFKGCQYSQFYIIISSRFWKIETKNLNSDPRILILLILGAKSPAAHYLNIRCSHEIEVAIRVLF